MNVIDSTQRLDSLEEHQTILQKVLSTARERVLIVSPYISISAINSENISTLVKQAVARGVRVQVFVDSQRNGYSNGTMKDRALEGIAALVHAGAQVGVCNDIQRNSLS
jgi:phosphatidylserine/phosphatidylglycerophosphate/cardiolipin synthase-like enzyme